MAKRPRGFGSSSDTNNTKGTSIVPNDSPTLDWISALAAQESSSTHHVLSKDERIERRENKRQRRLQRKIATTELPTSHTTTTTKTVNAGGSSKETTQTATTIIRNNNKKRLYRQRLKQLASTLQNLVDSLALSSETGPRPTISRPIDRTKLASTHQSPFKKRKWEQESLQPRKRDYGGIGLARPSLYIGFDDPSLVPKLEEEFAEHIPGFFGKQRTKAMKKQLNRNMLWKTMSENKNVKINGKKLSDMRPDERVEAMIKAGMV